MFANGLPDDDADPNEEKLNEEPPPGAPKAKAEPFWVGWFWFGVAPGKLWD